MRRGFGFLRLAGLSALLACTAACGTEAIHNGLPPAVIAAGYAVLGMRHAGDFPAHLQIVSAPAAMPVDDVFCDGSELVFFAHERRIESREDFPAQFREGFQNPYSEVRVYLTMTATTPEKRDDAVQEELDRTGRPFVFAGDLFGATETLVAERCDRSSDADDCFTAHFEPLTVTLTSTFSGCP